MIKNYEPIIGLEVHAQLLTKSKIFCSCKNVYGAEPNSNTCPVCLGMPGTLPVLNKKAVDFAIKMGLATGSKIAKFSRFARKNYFYPDLPKGYQISQYEEPLCYDGKITIRLGNKEKAIGITRIHLEEDAGKLIHGVGDVGISLVDYNRCGIPLIEIVSEPDIRSPEEAYAYLIKLKQILEYLEICDCNMEEGSLRCDANISLRLRGEKKFGTKAEMKNMNSFHGVQRALQFEIHRQAKILDKGEKVLHQTLLWNESKGIARPMRTKEQSEDYRYFPEPDLVPLQVDDSWINDIRDTLPELPDEKYNRFIRKYKLRDYDANLLVSDKSLADYFESLAKITEDYTISSNWIQTEVLRVLKEKSIDISQFSISPERMGELLKMVKKGVITASVGKDVFNKMIETDKSPIEIVEKEGLIQVSDESEIEEIIKSVIQSYPEEVEKYRAGKKALFGFFMGQVMKQTKGKANPQLTSKLLKDFLEGKSKKRIHKND